MALRATTFLHCRHDHIFLRASCVSCGCMPPATWSAKMRALSAVAAGTELCVSAGQIDGPSVSCDTNGHSLLHSWQSQWQLHACAARTRDGARECRCAPNLWSAIMPKSRGKKNFTGHVIWHLDYIFKRFTHHHHFHSRLELRLP